MMKKKNVPGMGRGSVHGVWRRATALLLALTLCLSMVSTTAWAATDTETVASQEDAVVTEEAEETEAEPESETETEIVQAEEVVWLNPFLEEALSETDLTASSEDETSEADAYADGEEAAAEELRAGLKARQETIVVGYTADSYEETAAESVAETALAHTGEAAEGDSLRLQLGGWRAAASYYMEDEICHITLTYTVTYLTTTAQEEEADAAVAEIAEELALSEGSAYEKASAIYGYLCAQVTCVDREEATKPLQYTAYAALTEGTVTDVGCAALTFRLALAAGLDARVIAGTWDDGSGAEPVNHVWNLIGLDGGFIIM